jgi:chromosome segregation protein
MRLEKIKLAGFKSFVDPTTVPFPSSLVGVVGPNGCGKSNVIDAVRWVMGESSAKMLRGESMADVIFNGSTGRKPVGMASIELVFDNADGGAGGQYATYSQVAVRRQVSRDGQSNYFLNGTRCRRRDIQDLFLGTGLGPRSYAIIEQGTISRLIEARPEDLRLFLEEAAGISKYKERRRETENRIRHTRDNLERLQDLRDEVGKQLLHLERQAAAAEKFKQLKAEERRLEAELKALRWRSLDQEVQSRDEALRGREVALEAGVARQRHLEADIDAKRDAFVTASDHFNSVQGRYYAVGAEIARLEQGIQFARESRARQEAELARQERELTDVRGHLERDRSTLAEIDTLLERDEPELEEAEEAREEAASGVAEAEAALKTWESEWDDFNRRAAAPAQQAQVERARINQLETRLGQDRARQTRLDDELGRLSTAELEAQIEDLVEREDGLEERLEALEAEREGLAERLAGHQQAGRALGERLDDARTGLQSARGRQSSLAALQEAALRDVDAAVGAWLREQGLDAAPRLADQITVGDGWERAAEVVLGVHLKAVCVDALDRFGTALAGAEGGLSLLETAAPASPGPPSGAGLLEKVRCPWPLQALLGGVRLAEDLPAALAARATLAPSQVLATRDGALVGHNWLRMPDADGAMGGVLARGEELKALERQIAERSAKIDDLMAEQERVRAARAELEAGRERLQAGLTEIGKSLSQVRADLTGRRTRLEHQHERRNALAAERAELDERIAEALEEEAEARERLHAALEEVEAHAERRETLAGRRERLRGEVALAREAERDWGEKAHRLLVDIESRRATREATARNLERAAGHRTQLAARVEELRAGLAESVEPLAEQQGELQEQLAQRLAVEGALTEARNRMEQLDTEVRGLEQERHRVEEDIRARQGELDGLRLARQERLVLRRTLEEQLAEASTSPQGVLAELEDGADEAVWQERMEKVGQRIQRLGAINLAAIDEFHEQSERKRYLDAQHEDIARSLETLEQAIRRIDRETRSRFKDTYDQVDRGFQQLFPRLFGGGHAYLELTGEDLLETGVSVMARPPGKRNSSIHLLSGGEKALTAVALVFAIFQLNPAPFCMLDEVDAPLDDANVTRFCELVRSMSDQVQFIFITHNKVTMEIADHLVGVTMQEPGVSRVVSVDVEEASRLAAM